MVSLYQCNTNSLTGFPVAIGSGSGGSGTQPRPSAENYAIGIEHLQGLIDFQFKPIVSGLTATASNTSSVILQSTDTESTVVYSALTYKILNVQLSIASHPGWLIAAPTLSGTGANMYDLAILLQATSPIDSNRNLYIVIIIPLLQGTTDTTNDPKYFTAVNNPGVSGTGLQSCFPSGALFANYTTCFDGYAGHAHTETLQVFVSTVGLSVSTTAINRILHTDSLTPKALELPFPVSTSQGKTSITIPELPHYITTTSFQSYTELASANPITNNRQDPSSAYKCVELDPDTVAADGNIHVDLETGAIASSTLTDILAERAILKDLANPPNNTNPKAREIGAFLLALFIVILSVACGYYFIFKKETNKTRSAAELIFTLLISGLVLSGIGAGLFADQDKKWIGGVVLGVGVLLGVFFYLIFFVAYPPVIASQCKKTVDQLLRGKAPGALGLSPATGTAITEPAATLAAGPSVVSAPWTMSPVQIGIVGAVFGCLGLIVGMII